MTAHAAAAGPRLAEEEYNEVVEEEETQTAAFDVVDRVVAAAMQSIGDKHIQAQLVPHALEFAEQACLQHVAWFFQRRDTGEVDSESWAPGTEPPVCEMDSWTAAAVPLVAMQAVAKTGIVYSKQSLLRAPPKAEGAGLGASHSAVLERERNGSPGRASAQRRTLGSGGQSQSPGLEASNSGAEIGIGMASILSSELGGFDAPAESAPGSAAVPAAAALQSTGGAPWHAAMPGIGEEGRASDVQSHVRPRPTPAHRAAAAARPAAAAPNTLGRVLAGIRHSGSSSSVNSAVSGATRRRAAGGVYSASLQNRSAERERHIVEENKKLIGRILPSDSQRERKAALGINFDHEGRVILTRQPGHSKRLNQAVTARVLPGGAAGAARHTSSALDLARASQPVPPVADQYLVATTSPAVLSRHYPRLPDISVPGSPSLREGSAEPQAPAPATLKGSSPRSSAVGGG